VGIMESHLGKKNKINIMHI